MFDHITNKRQSLRTNKFQDSRYQSLESNDPKRWLTIKATPQSPYLTDLRDCQHMAQYQGTKREAPANQFKRCN